MGRRDAAFRLLGMAALAGAPFMAVPCTARAQFAIHSFTTSDSTTQAGAHADFTTSFGLEREALGNPTGQLKNVTVELPAGVIGDPQAIERCSTASFQSFDCPSGAQVGVLEVSLVACRGVSSPLTAEALAGETTITVASTAGFCGAEPGNTITIGAGGSEETARIVAVQSATTLELEAPLEHDHHRGEAVVHEAQPESVPIPLFNLQPSAGHVATLGASLLPAPILIEIDVRGDGSYGLTATISEVSTLVSLAGASLTLWGVPGDASHDAMRCDQLGFDCGMPGASAAPFMSNPGDCGGPPLESRLTATSWQGEAAESTATLATPTGCEHLQIAPSLTVRSDSTQLDAPAGYEVELRLPQEDTGLATPDLKTVSVTLPVGTSLSPAVANGLQACGEAQFAAGGEGCPNASKIGTAEVTSSLLADHLTGAVYVGAPSPGEQYRIFVIVSADNVTVRLIGRVQPDEHTGQVTAVFEDAPQLPFSDFELTLFGGPTAVLANPSACGPAASTAQITSYGGQAASISSEPFVVEDEGVACPANLPFAPGFSAGVTSPLAGGFSPFTLTISREDGQQELASVTTQLPPGLVGTLRSVPLCPEPQAGEGSCPQSSQIGTATVGAGAGSLPFYVSGPVYLTGPYAGAPFGLSIAVDAVAGPFSLGRFSGGHEVVRAPIAIDPSDAHLTVGPATLPTILAGVPLRLRTVNLTVDRPDFMLNPTDCSSMMVTSAIYSTAGALESASSPFEVAECAGLPFAPELTATSNASASKADGASLRVTVTATAGQANIARADVDLPKQLPSRFSTLQKACLASVFNVSPASCPAASVVGTGTVHTPLLAGALSGPAYLVSHGASAFPDLIVVLQGEGITIDLVGHTHIAKSVISTAFASVPDVPISSFELVLPAGPHSLLAASGSLCKAALAMPSAFVGYNGATVKRVPRIAVSGCRRSEGAGSRRRR